MRTQQFVPCHRDIYIYIRVEHSTKCILHANQHYIYIYIYIYISKGLQCALTAITIVALWQLPHLGRGMCVYTLFGLHIYIYTKILEVNLFAFAYRLFRRDFSPLDGTYCMGTHSFLQPYIHFVLIWEGFMNGQS